MNRLLLLLCLLFLMTACNSENNASPTEGDAPAATGTAAVPPPAATAEPDEPESFAGTVPAPEFPAGLDWLNSDPLTLADLRGKVVLLDFWTYGCINCLHVIPELKQLEEKYADELVVIGVHSAKFSNEGETENIRRIVQRYELSHPVINDSDFVVWNTYGAQAWPTFVLIDPAGNVVGYHSGEQIFQLFDLVIGSLVDEFAAAIDTTPLDLKLEQANLANSPLLFPGKVLADPEHNRLFIADSNHNRIVVTDLDGLVLQVIGSGRAGFKDGAGAAAMFFRPQGLALADANTLYVADTENHLIRRVDLATERVSTPAGTGEQVFQTADRGPAWRTGLNSPWDVLWHDNLLYIAMAGQHQLWVYDPAREEVYALAGTREEALRDGPQLQGGLNQPSGLATDGALLYFADSEASAIRSAGLTVDGELRTIVGTGLFDFGDVDGVGDEVRLQHPLGIVFHEGLLYVADTYNSKIKVLDPASRSVSTIFGGDEAGWRDGAAPLFDEPGGLSVAGDTLFVADTNNHVIRQASLTTGLVTTLVLIDPDGLLTRLPPDSEEFPGTVITLPGQPVAAGAGAIDLLIEVPVGYKINDLAPFAMTWTVDGETPVVGPEDAARAIVDPSFPLTIAAVFPAVEVTLTADLVIYYCEEEAASLCLIEQVRLVIPLLPDAGAPAQISVTYAVPAP